MKKQINYLGCGISGGENGARNGPCMMAGGSKKCYDSFNLILNKISAKFNNEVCVDYFGENGIGNYIKMVHNGIEYALMQLISEVYLILKISYGLTNKEISNVFNNWNLNKLNSYLLEITIKILNKKDETSNLDLLDIIKDQVDSKGTGYMTVVDALEKKIPINIIYSALEFRNISSFIPKVNVNILVQPLENKAVKKDLKDILINLENGLYFCFILTFFQGINLIYQHYYLETSLKLNLVKLLKVWRNGCIIKCNLLNEFIQFIENDNQEINKIIEFIYKNINYYNDLNIIIKSNDLPIITLSNCFQFSNILNSKKLHSAQLLQAMRDCFGGHMYERTDIDGKIHTNWLQN